MENLVFYNNYMCYYILVIKVRTRGGQDVSKIVIIFASVHHKNTEKVISYIAPKIDADTVNIIENHEPDISGYDTVILASGIYYNTFHKNITEYIKNTSFKGIKVILFYTCGMRYRDYARETKQLLLQKKAEFIGDVYCRGYDTIGFLNKIGGIAKGHPSDKDMQTIHNKIEKLI